MKSDSRTTNPNEKLRSALFFLHMNLYTLCDWIIPAVRIFTLRDNFTSIVSSYAGRRASIAKLFRITASTTATAAAIPTIAARGSSV